MLAASGIAARIMAQNAEPGVREGGDKAER
jgi:hypothetical protein